VRYSQRRIEESEDLHLRALKQYQSTIRNRHHRTADVCHKMAQHCLRKRLFDKALGLIDQALKVWTVELDKYAPEIARTSYLKAKVLFSAGREEEATKLFKTAASMRRKIKIESQREDDRDLKEEDFDELVTFWSR
jgi:tetratricopeptide (TPR) repeat protein